MSAPRPARIIPATIYSAQPVTSRRGRARRIARRIWGVFFGINPLPKDVWIAAGVLYFAWLLIVTFFGGTP